MRKIFGSAKEIRVSEDLPDCFFYEYNDVVITVKDNFVIGIATYAAGGWQVETDEGGAFVMRFAIKNFFADLPAR